MRRLRLPILCPWIAACVLAAAAWRAPAAEPNDSVLTPVGAESYRQYCAACHGLDAAGDGPVASALKTVPPDLTRIAARHSGSFPDAEIARIIDGRFEAPAHGSREMPVWGRRLGEPIAPGTESDEVARGRVLALIEYLKSIQVKE